MDLIRPSCIKDDIIGSYNTSARSKEVIGGLSLFVIDLYRHAPRLELKRIKKMGGKAVDANNVSFDNYRVPGRYSGR